MAISELRVQVKSLEQPIEEAVSKVTGYMMLLWLNADDEPGPNSLRGYIERNAIALLSNYHGDSVDTSSDEWLGRFSGREKVRQSGLWNSHYVDGVYDPEFLVKFMQQIESTALGDAYVR